MRCAFLFISRSHRVYIKCRSTLILLGIISDSSPNNRMKLCVPFALTILLAAAVSAQNPPNAPNGPNGQKEGAIFSNEAIRQAQNTYLIPKDATIQKVQEGVELAAYESIPGNQRINLFEILGEHVPPEVVNNLQAQVDQVGKPQ